MEPASSVPTLEWGVARRPSPGETVSGDLHVVQPHRRGVLLAVIDGCGHGPEAAHAATLAAATLREVPESSVEFHFNRCHVALAATRGAVMTLADFNVRNQAVTLSGIGNVEATLFRASPAPGVPPQESALLRGGVVGSQMPVPYTGTVPVAAGDVLVMTSDGVKPPYDRDQALRLPPQRLADAVLDRNFKGNDDGLVLAVRFKENESN